MEQFIRYGTPAVPKGAVTGIGMSTSSTHTNFNNVLHGGIFGGIFQYGMRTIGEALLNVNSICHKLTGWLLEQRDQFHPLVQSDG